MRRLYPARGAIMLDGGLHNKFERSIIADNESPDCLNVVFNAGIVETRQGVTKVNTTAVSTSFAFDGLYTRRGNDNAETMVAFIAGTMWQLATTTFTTIGSAQSVFTTGSRVGAAQYQNYMFVGNGGVTPYKWDGSVFSRHGVYAPTTTLTVASANVVGALTASADYNYKITFVNTQLVESDVGPISATFTISTTSGQNTLSVIPTAAQSWGINARYIYRKGGATTSYKRIATLSDNTTTTYTDNIADSAQTTAAPTDNGVPPKYNAIIYHQNRLFMNDTTNENYVWYSDITGTSASPYTVPSTNFFKVGDNTSDLVKAFGVYDNALIVYCEKSIWINYMPDTTPGNWKQVKAKSQHGCKSPYAPISYLDKQLFPAMQQEKFVGFGALNNNISDIDTSLLTVFATASENKSDRIEPDMFLIQSGYLDQISGIVYKNKAYFSMTYGANQTTNNRIYVWDFGYGDVSKKQEGTWVPWTGLNAQQFTVYSGDLYYCSSDLTGFVFKMEAGVYTDNGAAIDSYFWTKEFSGTADEYSYTKDFRYANILIENTGAYYMNLTYRTDSDKGGGNTKQISLDPGSSLWGSMVWGVSTWGGGSQQQDYRQYLGQSRGKRLQLKFSNQNTAAQRFRVHRLNYTYNLKGFR